MKRSRNPKNGDQELEEALAVLITCTRTKRRPLPLTEVNRWLEVAVSKLGGYSQVADRIGLSEKMLRQFASTRRLSAPVRKLFQSRKLDSVDASTHLGMLRRDQQYPVAEELAAGKIDTADLRAIVQLSKAGGHGSARKLLDQVKASKTKRVYIAEFVLRGSHDRQRILRKLQKYISPENVIGLELEGPFGRLILTAKGRRELTQAAKTVSTSLDQVLPRILYA